MKCMRKFKRVHHHIYNTIRGQRLNRSIVTLARYYGIDGGARRASSVLIPQKKTLKRCDRKSNIPPHFHSLLDFPLNPTEVVL